MRNLNAISVAVQNNSGQSLFIGLNRADGPWLGGLNGATQTWTPAFDQQTCVKEITAGSLFACNFPSYDSGVGCRMYISEQTLTGAPDLATAKFIFDMIEMGWNAVWNQTSVDFFAIPLQLSLNGGAPVGYQDGVTRQSIFKALAATPAPYNTFKFSSDDQSKIYRYFAPGKASTIPGYDLGDCLAGAIATGMPLLQQYTGTFDYGGFNMSNFKQVSSTSMTATCNGETITLTDINSANAFLNSLKISPNDDGGKKVAGIIGCALNRGVLYDPTLWGESGGANNGFPQNYYVKATQNQSQFNYYAQALHDQALHKKCYAQSYDDFFNQEAAFTANGGDSVKITILPFTDPIPPKDVIKRR